MTRKQVTLELELEARPIAGWLHDEDGSVVPFAGWLELASALERVLKSGSPKP